MEGEVEFHDPVHIPANVSEDLLQLASEFISDYEEQVSNLFTELLEMRRAVLMIEVASPIRTVKGLDDLLRTAGYEVFISMDFEPVDEVNEELEEKYPDEVIVAAAVYVSLHEAFLDVARLADAGVCYQVSCGLLFGYRVKNIIGFIGQGGIEGH